MADLEKGGADAHRLGIEQGGDEDVAPAEHDAEARDLLSAELERSEPEAVAGLHQRAAAWCEAHGMPEAAIDLGSSPGARPPSRASALIIGLALPT